MWRTVVVMAAAAIALGLAWLGPAEALDYLKFRRDNKEHQVAGRVLVTAQDGGLMILARDGELWTVQPNERPVLTRDAVRFQPFSADELAQKLLAGLPEGFEVHRTAHYVILYGTTREYAQWCGALFERLYANFTNCWSKKGFALSEPEFPLVAIVFGDRQSYLRHAEPEAGEAAKSIKGYFNLMTNRMTMYDLSEGGASARGRGRGRTAAQINQILSQPEAAWNVATIVHEATHQIAFNCGLHTRFSDCPRWFSEGIAMYFETPDLASAKGWSSIGRVNRPRLAQFQAYLKKRPPDSLVNLLTNDKQFLDAQKGADAYAEAWVLTYFLIHRYPKQCVAYLRTLSAKKPLIQDDAATRLEEFKQAFGDDLAKLDQEMLRFLAKIR